MDNNNRYRIKNENVTSEEIDDEVIAVNLLNGNYYTTRDLGAFLWGRIQRSYSIERMRQELFAAFPRQREVIDRDLRDFVAKLEGEGLITAVDGSEQPPQLENLVAAKMPKFYAAPVFSCYSDMQDLLVLDPIHEVTDVGWPVRPAAQK